MNIDNLTHEDVTIETYRHEDAGYSMITVLLMLDGINVEAYKNSDLNFDSEQETKVLILKALGFNDKFIGHYNVA